jgi:hypothetical protein
MSKPRRKAQLRRLGLGSRSCPGGRRDSTAIGPPASLNVDSGSLVLPCRRRTLDAKDADAVAAVLMASGMLNQGFANGRLKGWQFYHGKWYVKRDGKTVWGCREDLSMYLHRLLRSCVLVDRAGRLRPFHPVRANIDAVRRALRRALTVHEDPMRALPAVRGIHD